MFKSTSKDYNPKIYQEMNSIHELVSNKAGDSDSEIISTGLIISSKQSDLGNGNSRSMEKMSSEGADEFESQERQMFEIRSKAEIVNDTDMRSKDTQETVIPVAQNGTVRGTLVSNSEERKSKAATAAVSSNNADERMQKSKEDSETLTKIAEHEKQLFELREQVTAYFHVTSGCWGFLHLLHRLSYR